MYLNIEITELSILLKYCDQYLCHQAISSEQHTHITIYHDNVCVFT